MTKMRIQNIGSLIFALLISIMVIGKVHADKIETHWVPISSADLLIFVPVLSKPATSNLEIIQDGGSSLYDLSWNSVSGAAYYQIEVVGESGEVYTFQTNELNFTFSGLPLGSSKVNLYACNQAAQCGVPLEVGTFNSNEQIRYVHSDILGSTILETDHAGNSLVEYRYQPFGKQDGAQDKDTIGYTGHLEDADLDLTYMQARYYDAEIGRFYSNDPMTYSLDHPIMSFNRYAYANNNPYNYTDPNGEVPLVVVALWILKEAGGEVFEQVTGVPAPTIKNMGEIAAKRVMRKELRKRKAQPGVYDFEDKKDGKNGGRYVGQSKDELKRLKDHANSGKFTKESAKSLNVKHTPDTTIRQREHVEQKRINELTDGEGASDERVTNRKNPVAGGQEEISKVLHEKLDY